MDMNNDRFLDIPIGNQINLVNRWHYDNMKGTSAQIGAKLLDDTRIGGQDTFSPANDRGQTSVYGLQIKTKRYEAFGKFGYVFPQKKYQSIGLMASLLQHQQNSYFGLNNYDAQNQTLYTNLIYQSIIGTTFHKYRAGFSHLYDRYDETFNQANYLRSEIVTGAFVEYTYSPSEKFSAVVGLRGDYHNLFGFFATPRLHVRYQLTPDLTLRAGAGRGQRTANIFAENTSIFVSSRALTLPTNAANDRNKAYGLSPEIAWNTGVNLLYDFSLFSKNGSISFEYYRTDFESQVIVDREQSPQTVVFYQLNQQNNGRSFSNSFQTELNYELVKKLDLRLAYRFFDVQTTYQGQLTEVPFVAKHRVFGNIAYEIKKWKFDYTLNWIGKKRIPATSTNPEPFRKENYSPNYWLMNAQVTHAFTKQFEAYIGVENMLDTRQTDLVNAANQPFSPYFDASLVWGQVIGRMIYGGIRLRIKS
jgi:outer membrane receptor for ferrienterochelin and colicin